MLVLCVLVEHDFFVCNHECTRLPIVDEPDSNSTAYVDHLLGALVDLAIEKPEVEEVREIEFGSSRTPEKMAGVSRVLREKTRLNPDPFLLLRDLIEMPVVELLADVLFNVSHDRLSADKFKCALVESRDGNAGGPVVFHVD